VSIKGSPQAWLATAIERQSIAGIVLPAALDLGRPLTLAESLAVTLILGRDQHPRFDRAATRWLAQFVLASPRTSLGESTQVTNALERIGSPGTLPPGLRALEDALRRNRHAEALRALDAFDRALA